MLIEAVASEFNSYFNRDLQYDTVLWFDPHREWEELRPHLQPYLLLLVF